LLLVDFGPPRSNADDHAAARSAPAGRGGEPDSKQTEALRQRLAGEPGLIGQWALVGRRSGLVLRFRANGTYEALGPGGVRTGYWSELPGGRLATWSDPSRPKRVNRFALNRDWLVIIDAQGNFHKHRRIVTPLPANERKK